MPRRAHPRHSLPHSSTMSTAVRAQDVAAVVLQWLREAGLPSAAAALAAEAALPLRLPQAAADSAAMQRIVEPVAAEPRPRSRWLRQQMSSAEWAALVAVANHNAYDFAATGDVAVRRLGKTILEADRNAAAREAGYAAVLGKLSPMGASPMNDVLVGWPPHLLGAPFQDLAA